MGLSFTFSLKPSDLELGNRASRGGREERRVLNLRNVDLLKRESKRRWSDMGHFRLMLKVNTPILTFVMLPIKT